MNRSRLFILLFIWLFLWPFRSEAADWLGRESVEGGVRHVHNPAEPLHGHAVYASEELWRIGGFSDADEELFGVISAVLLDEQDRLYVLDMQLSEVRVFDIDGSYLLTIGREGEGPGEFRYPSGMLLLPDGALGVIQSSPSKMVLFDADRRPSGDFPFQGPRDEGYVQLESGRRAGERLALVYELGNKDKTSWSTVRRLVSCDMDGTVSRVLAEAATHLDYADARLSEVGWNHFGRCWTSSIDGRVFARGGFTDYEVRVWTPEGELDRVIHREYPPHRRSREEIADIEEAWARGFGWLRATFEIEESWAPVHDLHAQRDGTLWVRTSRGWRGLEEGIMAGFDVFDRQGRFVHQVSIRGEFDPENDGIFLQDEYAIVVTDLVSAFRAFKGGGDEGDVSSEDDPTPMTVICYRLPVGEIASKTGR